MYRYEDIKEVHLEAYATMSIFVHKNLNNMNGGADNPITNAELSLDDAKRMFSKDEFIKQLNVMYMCGNLGDNIVARDTLEIFEYFREHNPTCGYMNTNAGAKDIYWWAKLAEVIGLEVQ